ncbi:MAG: ABC transporter ATP-binding protein [Oscillospiraceae bacterium]|nr:ABC transporter ATP-binding protein [Oscillospiraceae bacterium]
MLRITDLRKKYKNYEVLKGLNMNLEKGSVYGFLGKNGCGKTTTMNIICNIVPKDGGTIGFEAGSGQRPKIGYLTESPALYGFMNGYEYLRYIAACADYELDVEKRIEEVLEVTGMTEGARRRIKGYSRGMNQRLGIAAALFDHPELLILDEPTSALDPEGRAEVMNIILNLKSSGVTIILCTHIITDVERVADKIGIMKNGIIAEEGSIDSIMTKYRNQSKDITVRLADPHPDTAAPMRMLPSVNSSNYNGMNGVVTLGSDNIDSLYNELITLIYENKIKISELIAQKTTLEDVYFAITGLSGRDGVRA